jgi:hypothetical protein
MQAPSGKPKNVTHQGAWVEFRFFNGFMADTMDEPRTSKPSKKYHDGFLTKFIGIFSISKYLKYSARGLHCKHGESGASVMPLQNLNK